MEFQEIHGCQSLSTPKGSQDNPPGFHMDLEEFLSKQTQGICLVDPKRPIEHQRTTQKKTHGTARLQLCAL